MEKCQCYIHSLKQGENHVLGEATILKRPETMTIWQSITA